MCRNKACGGRRCDNTPTGRARATDQRRRNRHEVRDLARQAAGEGFPTNVINYLTGLPVTKAREYAELLAAQKPQKVGAYDTSLAEKLLKKHGETRTAEVAAHELHPAPQSHNYDEWNDTLSASENFALSEYTMNDAFAINEAFYSHDDGMAYLKENRPELVPNVEELDNALARAPHHENLVYRGVNVPVRPRDAQQYIQDNYTPGTIIELPSYTSTSYSPAIATGFVNHGVYSLTTKEKLGITDTDPLTSDEQKTARGFVFEIVTTNGASISQNSIFKHSEQEHLLPRNTRLQVIDVTDETYTNDKGETYTLTAVKVADVTGQQPALREPAKPPKDQYDVAERARYLHAHGVPRQAWKESTVPGATPGTQTQALLDQSQPWVDNLTDDQKNAIDAYTTNDYDTINRAFYAGEGLKQLEETDLDAPTTVKNLDAALASAPLTDPTVVYRGINLPHVRPNDVQQEITDTFKPGTVVGFPAYLSTSHDPGVAIGNVLEGYEGEPTTDGDIMGPDEDGKPMGYVMEIVTQRGAYLGHVSQYGTSEQERLLPRDTRLNIVSVTPETFITETGQKREYMVVQAVDVTNDPAPELSNPASAPTTQKAA